MELAKMTRRDFNKSMALGVTSLAAVTSSAPAADSSKGAGTSSHLEDDQPVSLRFFGSPDAELLTREFEESFQGVLRKNFVGKANDGFPAGFVGASPRGQIWGGTMWTRDGGTFMRELVMRGYYEHAALLADCLIELVEKNHEGFYSFPMFFTGSKPGTVDWPPGMTTTSGMVVPRSGTELDGTTSIIIGMVSLWERLPDGHPAKKHIREFLFQDASPVNYLKSELKTQPLVPGSGEFGGGMGSPGDYYNVVQNNLSMLALLAAANMVEVSGSKGLAAEYRQLAARVMEDMEKYLVDKDPRIPMSWGLSRWRRPGKVSSTANRRSTGSTTRPCANSSLTSTESGRSLMSWREGFWLVRRTARATHSRLCSFTTSWKWQIKPCPGWRMQLTNPFPNTSCTGIRLIIFASERTRRMRWARYLWMRGAAL
jgi:hypothetical protein